MPSTTFISPPTVRASDALRSPAPPPGADPGGFAALLDQTTARTAPAEGQQTRTARSEQRRRDDEVARRDGDASPAATDVSAATPPPPTVTPASDAAGPADGSTTPSGDPTASANTTSSGEAPVPTAPVDPAALAGLLPGATPVPAGVPSASAPVAVAAGMAGAPVLAGSVPGPPLDAQAAPLTGDPAAAVADGSVAGGLTIPPDLLAGAGGTAADGKGHDGRQGDGRARPDLPQPPIATDPSAAAPAAPAATTPAPVPTPASDAPAAPAPVAAPPVAPIAQPGATAVAALPVAPGAPQLTRASLTAVVERAQDLVRIAATRAGGARATLQLHPQELGAIDVHLRTTRAGLVATISAQDQAGLTALQHAGPELKRSLEDRGVHLHSLDLQLGAGEHGFTNQGDARQASPGGRGGSRGWGLGGEDEPLEDELTIAPVACTPAGVLVDVQA